jgi:hypothetical protein
MSVGLISFFSFLTGVGSCAAFQAALKVGMYRRGSQSFSTDNVSNSQLANTSRLSDCISISGIRSERILLHHHSWICISGRYLRFPSASFFGYVSSRTCFYPFSACRQPPEGYSLLRSPF